MQPRRLVEVSVSNIRLAWWIHVTRSATSRCKWMPARNILLGREAFSRCGIALYRMAVLQITLRWQSMLRSIF